MRVTTSAPLAIFIQVVCLLSSVVFSVGFAMTRVKSPLHDLCYGYCEEFYHILQIYQISSDSIHIPKLAILIAFLIHLYHTSLYIVLYHFLYQHEKSVATYLPKKQAMSRRRRTAVSFMCDMYFYLVETMTTVIFALTRYLAPPWVSNFVFIAGQCLFLYKNSAQAMSTERPSEIFLMSLEKFGRPFDFCLRRILLFEKYTKKGYTELFCVLTGYSILLCIVLSSFLANIYRDH